MNQVIWDQLSRTNIKCKRIGKTTVIKCAISDWAREGTFLSKAGHVAEHPGVVLRAILGLYELQCSANKKQ